MKGQTWIGITVRQLRKLLLKATQESHFVFNGKYYDQIDGIAMGSPLGPTFANIFIADLERKHMDNLHKLGVNTWLRFVDDTFVTVGNIDQVKTILDYLNSLHDKIKFTFEVESDNRLSFLDVVVKRKTDGGLTTNIYRKKTFTGTYLN